MGIRTRRARLHSRTHVVGFGIAGIFGFMALLAVALTVSLGSLINQWLQDLPDYSSAKAYLVAEPTTVYAADGSVIAEYYLQNRRSVEYDQISPYVLKGVVDTEDIRFYQHNGVDPQGIVRAAIVTLTGGSEGASTITQQLVRNTVLVDQQFEMSLKRKIREAYIAVQMEKMYTKDQILTMYLNTIYFGHNAYGIQAASITYFNKNASELTLAEAATLAGLPQSPSGYDPLVRPDLATARRNVVLDHMLSAGDITQEEHDAAVAEPLVCNEGSFSDGNGEFPYFAGYVKQLLLSQYGPDVVMKGGLKVYTTLDPATQRAAEKAVADQLDATGQDELNAALVAIRPDNGNIVAMVGGRDYDQSQFNVATGQRQPGSSFKMFTLVTALSQGMNPQITINANSPLQVTPTWKPKNIGNISYGNITLAQAFAVSSNTAFVQVAQAVGNENIISTAQSMGITSNMRAFPSLTLGTEPVSPLEMAEAYATVAAGGVHRNAVAITKIEDRNGNVAYEHTDNPTQVIDPAVAQEACSVMQSVTSAGGTASAVSSSLTIGQPAAGKTGTSEEYRDLWFCGITPQLSCAVWVGYNEEKTVRVFGSYAHPSNTAVPMWINFVNEALANAGHAEFPTTDATINYKSNDTWQFNGKPLSTGYSSWSYTKYRSSSSDDD